MLKGIHRMAVNMLEEKGIAVAVTFLHCPKNIKMAKVNLSHIIKI